jgi:transcription-repair coupling factor (superfamily II helicase)
MPSIILDLKKNTYPRFKDLVVQLTECGFRRHNMVMEPGEFAVRGNIIDVYSPHHSHPLRIEFDGDNTIDRMVSFHVHSQRALTPVLVTEVNAVSTKNDVVHVSQLGEEALNDNLLSDIAIGDYVVHENYGVGQYQGLQRLKLGKNESEFLFVKYRGEDKLYVPLDQLHFIHRYSGPDLNPTLNSLHDGAWKKTKAKVKKETEVLAGDIYLLYKLRSEKMGFSFQKDTALQLEFEKAFEHTPTADQACSSQDIKADMESSKPMDRVLCGDVGYGKTEVLIRAAFKACENKKQVAVLVPTTILAHQHFQTFCKRFEGFPYKVEVLSRFKTLPQQKAILQKVGEHKIDVLIGTHRILQKDIKFQDAGLLIVDEEQRFGVSHKEKIKQLFPNIDALSVSATPIPRTLYMALTGARDFSTLNTPPHSKKPVFTKISEYSDERVKTAIETELQTGGQVYYISNNVQGMIRKSHALKKLVPQARIGFAHGQMPEALLEKTMIDFLNHDIDVLLCSTIVENGLDFKNVNTIIIEDADQFGLSQIHQLRGRVGRSEKQGYAYLFYNSVETLSEKGQKRLQAIKEYAALGSGYKLAMKDLEIRGAGSLLGKKQHGHITSVGFELYCKLLSDSVHRKKGEKTLIQKSPLQLKPDMQAFIPDSYVEDPRERLALYQRLSHLKYRYNMDDLEDELSDRYGKIPLVLQSFLDVIRSELQ